MKLIISYTEGNGCSYSNDVIEPALYSSAEDLYCDFIDSCEKAFKEKERHFKVGNMEYDVSDFICKFYDDKYIRVWPDVMTIDEWFEKSEKSNELLVEE